MTKDDRRIKGKINTKINNRGTLPLRELMITIVVIAAIILFIIAVTKVLKIFN